MIDDKIRKYNRVIIGEDDKVDVNIVSISNYKGEAVLRPIAVDPIDVGAYGMKFICRYQLTKGAKIGMTIRLYDKKIETVSIVVRVEKVDIKYNVAVSFIGLTEYQVLILSSYIKRKTVDSIRKLRE